MSELFEIGELRSDELEGFLQLMCVAFEMDVEAARPIFYSDPYFELHNRIVLRVDGKIASCLTVVDRECWIGAAIIRVAGIAGVATNPEQRRRGYAGRLLTATLGRLARRGVHTTLLFPSSQEYYRRFGWETACSPYTSIAALKTLYGPPSSVEVRTSATGDIAKIAKIYEAAARGRCMHCRRDPKRWDYLLTYLPRGCVACAPDGQIGGYALFDLQPILDDDCGNQATGPSAMYLRVLEMHATGAEYAAALRRYLGSQPAAQEVRFSAPPDTLAACGFSSPITAADPFMARIVDWVGMLRALAANWRGFQGRIELVATDSWLLDYPRAVTVQGTGSEVDVLPVASPEMTKRCRDFVVGDVRAWSAVAVGHAGGAEAFGGLLRPSTPAAAAIAAHLFPKREPFLPAADHF